MATKDETKKIRRGRVTQAGVEELGELAGDRLKPEAPRPTTAVDRLVNVGKKAAKRVGQEFSAAKEAAAPTVNRLRSGVASVTQEGVEDALSRGLDKGARVIESAPSKARSVLAEGRASANRVLGETIRPDAEVSGRGERIRAGVNKTADTIGRTVGRAQNAVTGAFDKTREFVTGKAGQANAAAQGATRVGVEESIGQRVNAVREGAPRVARAALAEGEATLNRVAGDAARPGQPSTTERLRAAGSNATNRSATFLGQQLRDIKAQRLRMERKLRRASSTGGGGRGTPPPAVDVAPGSPDRPGGSGGATKQPGLIRQGLRGAGTLLRGAAIATAAKPLTDFGSRLASAALDEEQQGTTLAKITQFSPFVQAGRQIVEQLSPPDRNPLITDQTRTEGVAALRRRGLNRAADVQIDPRGAGGLGNTPGAPSPIEVGLEELGFTEPTPRANTTNKRSVTDTDPQAAADAARIQQRDRAVAGITSRLSRGQGTSPFGGGTADEPGLPTGSGVIVGPDGVARTIDTETAEARRTRRPPRISTASNDGATLPNLGPTVRGDIVGAALPLLANRAGRSGGGLTRGQERLANVDRRERELGLNQQKFATEQGNKLFEDITSDDSRRREAALPRVVNQALAGDRQALSVARAGLGVELARAARDPEISAAFFNGQGPLDAVSNFFNGTGDLSQVQLNEDDEILAPRENGSFATIGHLRSLPPEYQTLLRRLTAAPPARIQARG